MKKLFVVFLIMTLNFLFCQESAFADSQTSSDLVIKDGKDSFKIKRESCSGIEIITISSTTEKYYYIDKVSDASYKNSNINYLYNGKETDTDIIHLEVYRATNRLYRSNRVSFPFSTEPKVLELDIINNETPGNSYKLKLNIKPRITIVENDFNDEEKLKTILELNPSYKRYFYNQLIGAGLFIPTSDLPIPSTIHMDGSNNLILDYDSSLVIDSNTENSLFNSIYNNSFSNGSKSGFSIIHKILNIYYRNGKPIFHSFINDLLEEGNFNYDEYSLLSRDEGEVLVSAALKYLTWGVEYTPSINKRSLETETPLFPSSKVKGNKTLLDWIRGNDVDGGSRINNYYTKGNFGDGVNKDDPTYSLNEVNGINKLSLGLNITTPFGQITGAAIPYAQGGIDSPRTFNYKMEKQMDILDRYIKENPGFKWYGSNNNFSITNIGGYNLSAEKFYFRNWESFIDSDVDLPYFPGYGDSGEYQGSNLTGVDGVGLLTGSIAMTPYYNKILGVDGATKAVNLDSFYKMNGELNRTFLKFLNNPEVDLTDLRLSNKDFEKATVIVPKLSEIQPGDLLVSTNKLEPEVGIVVKNNYKSGSFKFTDIIVISATRKLGRVALQYWDDFETPKSFLVRRLLKYNGDLESPTKYTGEDLWDPFEYISRDLKTKIEVYNKYGKWIPNTGELLLIDSIKFVEKSDTLYEPLELSDIPVTIIAPTDLYFDSADTHSTNINNNKGLGFEFYAVRRYIKDEVQNNDYIKLALFRLNEKNISENGRYTVEYDDNIFQIDGFTKDNYKLIYNGDELEFSCGDISTTTFGIRPLSNNIRPGDDIVLNFALNINGNPNIANGNNQDYLGVYDKKMLWRANLYIDDGSGDWNNKNKWNAPSDLILSSLSGPFLEDKIRTTIKNAANEFSNDYNKCFVTDMESSIWFGPNEWNINNGGGGQVVKIDSFTYNPHITVRKADGVVAYSYGGSDSPFEFNSKMNEQKSFLQNEFNIDGFKYKDSRSNWQKSVKDKLNFTGVSVNDYIEFVYDYNKEFNLFPSGAKLLGVWDKTLSPGNYGDYVNPSEVFSNIRDTETPYNSDFNKMKDVDKFPYVPGWALWYRLEYKKAPPNWVNGISAGVDCIGFATRSASYLGNNYKWGDGRAQDVKDSRYWYVYVNYPYYKDVKGMPVVSELIMQKNPFGAAKKIDRIKPGDIMYQEISNGEGLHVAIIQNVDRNEKTASYSGIKLIESTWENSKKWATVFSNNSILDYQKSKYSWNIVRLNI